MFKKVYCHDEITHFCQGNYYNNRLFQIFSFSTQVFFLMSRLICLVSEADGNAFASLFFFLGGGRQGKVYSERGEPQQYNILLTTFVNTLSYVNHINYLI